MTASWSSPTCYCYSKLAVSLFYVSETFVQCVVSDISRTTMHCEWWALTSQGWWSRFTTPSCCSVSHLTQSWLWTDMSRKSYAAAAITRALCHIRLLLTLDVAKIIGHSTVSSQLDYANALLHGTSVYNINRLQVAQNLLVRTVCQAPLPTPLPSSVSQCHRVASSASLAASLTADFLQGRCHHLQDTFHQQTGLPLWPPARLPTCPNITIIGQTVTVCTADGVSILGESLQRQRPFSSELAVISMSICWTV